MGRWSEQLGGVRATGEVVRAAGEVSLRQEHWKTSRAPTDHRSHLSRRGRQAAPQSHSHVLVPVHSRCQEGLCPPSVPPPCSRWAPGWRVEKGERTLGVARESAPWQRALKEARRMRPRSLAGQEQGLAIPK